MGQLTENGCRRRGAAFLDRGDPFFLGHRRAHGRQHALVQILRLRAFRSETRGLADAARGAVRLGDQGGARPPITWAKVCR